MNRRGLPALLSSALVTLALGVAVVPQASAADTVYYAGDGGDIRSSGLAGGTVTPLYSGLGAITSLAIDPTGERLVFSRFATGIQAVPIAGGGAATTLHTDGSASGVETYAGAGSVYWTNNANQVRRGALAGGGTPVTLYTNSLQLRGVAVDQSANRIYWASANTNQIFGAPLDGSGPIVSLYGGASGVNGPYGVAVDPATHTLYWTNAGGGTIQSGPADASAAPTTLFTGLDDPRGIAVDPDAGRIFWTTFSGDVSSGPIAGGAATPIQTGQGTVQGISVMKAPVSVAPPSVSGSGQVGGQLTCTTGGWEDKGTGTKVYNAPADFDRQWQRNGVDIPTETGADYTPTTTGSYTCEVTATNVAGASAVSSNAVDVQLQPSGPFPTNPDPGGNPGETVAPAKRCNRLAKKLRRWQAKKLRLAKTSRKRAFIQKNIKDTKRRIKKNGC